MISIHIFKSINNFGKHNFLKDIFLQENENIIFYRFTYESNQVLLITAPYTCTIIHIQKRTVSNQDITRSLPFKTSLVQYYTTYLFLYNSLLVSHLGTVYLNQKLNMFTRQAHWIGIHFHSILYSSFGSLPPPPPPDYFPPSKYSKGMINKVRKAQEFVRTEGKPVWFLFTLRSVLTVCCSTWILRQR